MTHLLPVAVLAALCCLPVRLNADPPTLSWPVNRDTLNGAPLNGTFAEPRPEGIPSRFHKGIDIPRPNYWSVRRAAEGTVTYRGETSVVIHHGSGWHTKYVHIAPKGNVVVDDPAPEVIGEVEAYNHVHLGVYEFDEAKSGDVLQGYYDRVRNPLNYPALDDYPDQNTPTVSEPQFNTMYRDFKPPSQRGVEAGVVGMATFYNALYNVTVNSPTPVHTTAGGC